MSKVIELRTSISVKQSMRLKHLEKSKQPISLRHIITDEYGSRYEVSVDFGDGYNEAYCIDAINKAFPLMEGRPVSVELAAIEPIPDRSNHSKPQAEC